LLDVRKRATRFREDVCAYHRRTDRVRQTAQQTGKLFSFSLSKLCSVGRSVFLRQARKGPIYRRFSASV
jgi:hypothetical protein